MVEGPDFKAVAEESGSVLWFGHKGSFYTCKSLSGRSHEDTKGLLQTSTHRESPDTVGSCSDTRTHSIERPAQKRTQDLVVATTPSLMSGSQDVIVPTLQPLPAPNLDKERRKQ